MGPSRDPSPDEKAGEIYEIFVQPEVIGTGVGRALLRRALSELADAGFGRVTLWVVEGNTRACRFYERMGLRTDGSTKVARMGEAEAVEIRYQIEVE